MCHGNGAGDGSKRLVEFRGTNELRMLIAKEVCGAELDELGNGLAHNSNVRGMG